MVNVIHPLDPIASVEPFEKVPNVEANHPPKLTDVKSVTDEWFVSEGTRCHGWLVLPERETTNFAPLVVMGHGFGGQKDMGLMKYAWEFAQEGIASFVIDYRGLGASDGMPRNEVDPSEHVKDFIVAVNHMIDTRSDIDTSRIALFGTSMSGGLVIEAAAALGDKVKAVVSQAPTLDGRQNTIFNMRNRGILASLRLVLNGLTDLSRRAIGLSTLYLPIVGLKGRDIALMEVDQKELDAYYSKHPPNQKPSVPYLGGWQPKVAAAVAVKYSRMRPIRVIEHIAGPILFIRPAWDSVVPNHVIPQAAKLSKNPRTRIYQTEYGHFEQYTKAFDATVNEMLLFLKENI